MLKGKVFKQFKIRLAVVLISIAAIVLSLSFGICYTLVNDQLIENSEKTSLQVFQQMENTINLVADQVEKIVIQLMTDSHVLNFLHSEAEEELAIISNHRALIKMIDKILLQNSFIDAIVLFSEDGRRGGSSLNKTYFNLIPTRHPFLDSNDYRSIMKQSPHFVWTGGYGKNYFYNYDSAKIKNHQENKNLVVAKTISTPNGHGIILVMLKEDIFRAYYDTNFNHDSEVSIVDTRGMKISSVNTFNIGKIIPYIDKLDMQSEYGSMRYTDDIQDVQVTYYTLPKYKWVLINEIPRQVYTNDILSVRNTMIAIVIVTVAIMAAFFSVWVMRYTNPIQNLINTMRKVSSGEINERITQRTDVEELEELNQQFNNMLDQVQYFMEVAEKKEKEKGLLEMQTLQMQINPHFLYNTINSIRWMAVMNGADNVGDAMVNLAELLNASFRKNAIIWEIAEELRFVNSYTKLMIIRYGTGLNFELEVEESVKQYLIPKFIIQPILENSIKYRKPDGEVLRIHIKIFENDKINIVITDNGDGMEFTRFEQIKAKLEDEVVSNEDKGDSIGLCNVNRRLKLYYEDAYELDIKSHEGEGTQVKISIPKIQSS